MTNIEKLSPQEINLMRELLTEKLNWLETFNSPAFKTALESIKSLLRKLEEMQCS